MATMPVTDLPWWRWRQRVRGALRVLSDVEHQRRFWASGQAGSGNLEDTLDQLVGDTWLDRWSAAKYVPVMLRDGEEAQLVDDVVAAVLAVVRAVEPGAPDIAYLAHADWPRVVRAARTAHVRLAAADGDDPARPLPVPDVMAVRYA
jgi:hypothetical protein